MKCDKFPDSMLWSPEYRSLGCQGAVHCYNAVYHHSTTTIIVNHQANRGYVKEYKRMKWVFFCHWEIVSESMNWGDEIHHTVESQMATPPLGEIFNFAFYNPPGRPGGDPWGGHVHHQPVPLYTNSKSPWGSVGQIHWLQFRTALWLSEVLELFWLAMCCVFPKP